MAQASNTGTIAAVVGGLGALGVGAFLWSRRADAAVPAATRQTLEDALRKGGTAGCQAAAMAYKVPPSVSGPLCGLGSLVAVAGLKAAGKGIGKGAAALAHTGVGRGVGKAAKGAGKVALAPIKTLGKILHLGDVDADLLTYAQSRPGRARQRVKGGLRARGRSGCSGPCGCAPCGAGGGGRHAYLPPLRRRGKKTGGRAFYLAQLG